MAIKWNIPSPFPEKPVRLNAKTQTQGECNEKQAIINELATEAARSKNKAVTKALLQVKRLGVLPNTTPEPDYLKQPICLRRASAINLFRQVRTQLKAIDTILTNHKL
jgi:hypothetical protein